MKDNYPLNLVKTIYGEKYNYNPIFVKTDFELIDKSVEILTEKEAKVIELWYKDKLTMDKIAAYFNSSNSNIKHIKANAILKIKRYIRYNHITKDTVRDFTPVEDIFMSPSIAEKLIRYGYYTFKDLKDLTYEDLLDISCIGEHKANKIISRMKELGIDINEAVL